MILDSFTPLAVADRLLEQVQTLVSDGTLPTSSKHAEALEALIRELEEVENQ